MKVPVLLPNIFDHPFTYTSKEKLKIGDYVEVPFGKKNMVGIIWDDFEEGSRKKFKIKEARLLQKLSTKNIFLNGKEFRISL